MNWILILGARSDIAMATAHRFASEGFNLYLAARKSKSLAKNATDMEIRHGVECKTIEWDAQQLPAHKKMVRSLVPPPIGIITAAGYLGEQEQTQDDAKLIQRVMDVNVTGITSVIELLAPELERRHDGFVIAISSVAGDRGRQSNYFYGAAKAALSTYMSGLRNRLFASGVQVLTVKPGFVRTAMTKDMELPEKLTVDPERVADDIYKAYRKKKSVIYSPWFWRYIMLIIQHIPETIFKRLKL